MSYGYTLDHVVGDLVDERSNPDSQNRAPRGSDFYYDSWEALNRWLESRLKNRQGGSVSPLGNFTWEFKDMEDGTRQCRPIFLLGDSFRKDHHIRGNKFHPPKIAPSEEANFSLMAIKFSKSLTKDMLFAGIRDIIKKIGDYVDRIYEVEIEFSFGILRSKERRVTFEFDNGRLRQILPRAMAAELEEKELGYSQEKSQFNNDYHQEAQPSAVDLSLSNALNSAEPKSSARYDNAKVPGLDFTFELEQPDELSYYDKGSKVEENVRETNSPATSNDTSDKKPFQMPKLLYNGTYKDVDPNAEQRPVSPGLQKVLESYDKELFTHQAKVARRMKACDNVAQQAFNRCLNRIENETAMNDYIDYQDRMLQNDWNEYSAHQRREKQKVLDSISNTVQQQMKREFDQKRADKLERKMTKVPLGLPGQVIQPGESREAMLKKKEEMRIELRNTIDREQTLKKELKNTIDQQDRDALSVLAKEIDVESIIDRKNKLAQQRDLLNAWEREAHVRNLQSIQKKRGNLSNVQTYIDTTELRDGSGAMSGRSASGTGGFRMGSVGFDPRKNK
mmetsp:Transcript_24746/g.41847  ORF Transcript_24746/g.41847 Transcript_24746/m.41847 type:complete len:562 (+) Transcript_24746:125-1810(+)